MKEFFIELFQYNHKYNVDLIRILSQQPIAHEECIRLMSHILNAHEIWNLRIVDAKAADTRWDVHPAADLEKINQQNFELSNTILNSYDLNQLIYYKTSNGKPFANSVRDILFQIINHSTYHKGQIATAFRKAGLEPLLTEYIHYKMNAAKNNN